MSRFESKRDVANLTQSMREAGERVALDGGAVADDAASIAEIYTGQHDAPTLEDAQMIADLQRQVRERVESTMETVREEQSQLEAQMGAEAAERADSASLQGSNEREYEKLYGLNRQYDNAAIDQILSITRESIDFQLNQQAQTEQAREDLSAEMNEAIARLRTAFSRLHA